MDQTGKVRAAKKHLPIDVVVIDENAQAKHPRVNKSSPNASSEQEHQSSVDDDNEPDGLLLPNSHTARNLMPRLKSCSNH